MESWDVTPRQGCPWYNHPHESDLKEVQPKLETDKARITPFLGIMEHAVQSLDNVLRADRYQQQNNLKLTKGSKHRNIEHELGYER